MKSTIHIEEATNADINSLVRCWSAIDDEVRDRPFGGDNLPIKLNRSKTMIEHALESPSACILVARQQTAIIGTISGHIFERPTVKHACIGVIYSLWVDAAYRRQGLGQRLLTTLETRLSAIGAEAFQVGWDVPNQLAAVWWQRRGYQPYEVIASKIPVQSTSSQLREE